MPHNSDHPERRLATYARVVLIDRALRSGATHSRASLAELLDADIRTVQRDLNWMRRDLGVRIHVSAYDGIYYDDDQPPLPGLAIEIGGVRLVLFAEEAVDQLHARADRESIR